MVFMKDSNLPLNMNNVIPPHHNSTDPSSINQMKSETQSGDRG